MWEFQRVNFEELPKKFRPGLRRLINYVYSVRQKKVPMATTVDICYSDSKPGYSWANIIELDDGWNLVGLLPTRLDTTKVLREVCRATRSAVHRSTLSCGVLGPLPAGITGMQMHSVATRHSNGVCVLASRIQTTFTSFTPASVDVRLQRFSVNINDHTIKLKPENEYVRLETSEFDSLLEELTEFVHNQHSEADHYSEADHCSEAEQEVLEVEPVVKVEQTVAALCDQAVSPTARSRTVKVKIEIDLTGQGTVCNITSSRTTCLSEIHSLNSSSAFGAGDTPKPKKVKLEQGEHVTRLAVALPWQVCQLVVCLFRCALLYCCIHVMRENSD